MGCDPDDFDHVTDRVGHDLRYAIDPSALRNDWAGAQTIPISRTAFSHHRLVSRQRIMVATAERRRRAHTPNAASDHPRTRSRRLGAQPCLGPRRPRALLRVVHPAGVHRGDRPPFRSHQANCSVSAAGVLRGLHFAQLPPSQAKFVTCMRGSVFDVVVDIRVGSPTYGQWDSVLLDDRDRRSVYLSEGLAHGFLALEDDSTVMYLCSAPYAPDREHTILATDPHLAIGWPTWRRRPRCPRATSTHRPSRRSAPGPAAHLGRHLGLHRAVAARRRADHTAHNTTVTTSAATLIAAWGAGFHPRSENPSIPTVRESANATSEPTANAARPTSTTRGHRG